MICLTNLSWEITTVFISVCCQNLMGLADSVGVFASKISTPLRKFHYLLISSGSPLCMAAPSFRFQAFEENNVLRPLFDSEGKLMFKPMWFLVILSFPEVTKKRNFSLHYQCILVSERERKSTSRHWYFRTKIMSDVHRRQCRKYVFDLKSERARITQAVNN